MNGKQAFLAGYQTHVARKVLDSLDDVYAFDLFVADVPAVEVIVSFVKAAPPVSTEPDCTYLG